MERFTTDLRQASSAPQPETKQVLGNTVTLNLDLFPELSWLHDYLTALHILQLERDRLEQEIQAIEQEGEAYHDQWIEPYTKTKNGKQYTYHQLRWLTGEYKPSGQPKVKTKHLCQQAVGQVRAAIERGQQIQALKQQQHLIEADIDHLKQRVRHMGDRLKVVLSQPSMNLLNCQSHEP